MEITKMSDVVSHFLRVLACLCCLFLVAGLAYGQQEIQVRNSAHYVSNGRYDWTVCLKADQSVLKSIDYVEYTLHPTFSNPVRRGEGPNFSLSSNGWGEFNILLKIVFKNGRMTRSQHWLALKEESVECSKSTYKRALKKRVHAK
jgi:transcription initiation factor IIF auxiliary subunit